eukprot:s38_g3.t1
MTVEDLKVKARRGTQPFPCGQWRFFKDGGESLEFTVSEEGHYERKRIKAADVHGQLIQDHENPWKWRAKLDTGSQLELMFADDCKLKRRLIPAQGGEKRSDASHQGGRSNDPGLTILATKVEDHQQYVCGILLDAKAARDSWLASLSGIMQYFIAHPNAEESMPVVHQIFDWVDGFNKRYEVLNGKTNPLFDDFMQEVANFVRDLVRNGSGSEDGSQRLVCATHFVSCLFKRWSFVTRSVKEYGRFYITSWEVESRSHKALKACRDQYAQTLERNKGSMHHFLNRLSDRSLRFLMEQLESLASRQEEYTTKLPYVCLLEMAIVVSGRTRTELPLLELKVEERGHKFFNLEFVLSRCAKEYKERQEFSFEAPQQGWYAAVHTIGCGSLHVLGCCDRVCSQRSSKAPGGPEPNLLPSTIVRCEPCIDVVKDKFLGGCKFVDSLCLAKDACEGANAPELFKMVVDRFKQLPEMKKCLTQRYETGKSITDEVLRPLLEVRHFASTDLQEVLNHAVTLQVEAAWQFADVARVLIDISMELSTPTSLASSWDDSKQFFLCEVRNHEAFAKAARAAYSKFPYFIETMLPDLARTREMLLDIRCGLCIDLLHLRMQCPRLSAQKVDSNYCEEMLRVYCEASRFAELLPLLLQEWPACRTVRIEVAAGVFEPGLAGAEKFMRWSSRQEQMFFEWLGVEGLCQRPELVLQRLMSDAGVIHHFLQVFRQLEPIRETLSEVSAGVQATRKTEAELGSHFERLLVTTEELCAGHEALSAQGADTAQSLNDLKSEIRHVGQSQDLNVKQLASPRMWRRSHESRLEPLLRSPEEPASQEAASLAPRSLQSSPEQLRGADASAFSRLGELRRRLAPVQQELVEPITGGDSISLGTETILRIRESNSFGAACAHTEGMAETSTPGAENEELRTWRIRALQAEAEVRSLKRTRPLQGESETGRPAETRRETSRVDFGMQTELVETVDEFHAAEARERLRSSPVGSDSSPLSEIEELRQQLKQRDTAIVQLQADSHREHQSKQRKAVEQQQMYLEELREMTQRAESLMDQLRKSKKSGRELQAAREAARDEFLTARCELQECQAQLRRQVFVPSQSSEPLAGVREEAEAAMLGDSKDTGEELSSFGRAFAPDPWRGQAKVAQSFGTLRKLHSELSKELQSRSGRGGKPTEDAVSRILQQMDKALLDGPSPASDGSRATVGALRLPPSSPEAERPVPEDQKDFKMTSSATSAASPQEQKDSDEVLLLKLDVNAVRVAAELEKEKLISEHCDQLDDLVRQHDKERRKLQNELTELRSKQLCSEAMEHCRTPSASFRSQWALPDSNGELQGTVGTAGLHPRAPDPSGQRRTSTASSGSQWALPDFIREDFIRERQILVGTAGLEPRVPEASGHCRTSSASRRGQRALPDCNVYTSQKECQRGCQRECQIECQRECQKECWKECQTIDAR